MSLEYIENMAGRILNSELSIATDMYRESTYKNKFVGIHEHEPTKKCLDYWINDSTLPVSALTNIAPEKIAAIIFGFQSFDDINKEFYMNKFKESLINDIDFYKEALKNALDNKLPPKLENYNISIFNNFIDIGITAGHFNKIEQLLLRTENKKYLEVLKNKGVYNEEFDYKDFISVFSQKTYKINQYLSTHLDGVIHFLSDEGNLSKINSDMYFNMFSNIVSYKSEDKSKYSDFIFKFMNHETVQNFLFDNKNKNDYEPPKLLQFFIQNYPEMISKYIFNLSSKNSNNLYNITHHSGLRDNQTTIFGVLKYILENKIINEDSIKIIDVAFDSLNDSKINTVCFYNKYVTKDVCKLSFQNYIKSYLAEYSEVVHDKSVSVNHKEAFSNLVMKNLKNIASSYKISDNNSKVDFQITLNILNEEQKELFLTTLNNKVFKDIISDFTCNQNVVDNMPKYINNYNAYGILDEIYKNNLQDTLVDSAHKVDNKTVYKEDFPLSLYLIHKTNGNLLNWYLNKEQINELPSIKYKGKNFIDLAIKDGYYKKVVEILSKDEEFFYQNISNNKKVLNKLVSLGNTEINAIIMTNRLNHDVPKNNDTIKKVKL